MADQHLRELVAAIRAMNASQSDSDARKVNALRRGYKQPRAPLDAEAALRELEDLGTTNRPRDISPELRLRLILLLKGKITLKRGRKSHVSPRALIAAAEAGSLKKAGLTMTAAIADVSKRARISKSAISAVQYPRKPRRKFT